MKISSPFFSRREIIKLFSKLPLGAFILPLMGCEGEGGSLQIKMLNTPPFTDANKFFRPLNGNLNNPLPRDKNILNLFKDWGQKIVLAQKRHKIKFNNDYIFQISNLKGDLTAYTATITDTAVLQKILATGKGGSEAAKKLLSGIKSSQKADFLWGTLFWLRRIYPVYDGSKLSWTVGEYYWLDIFVRRNKKIAVPAFRVYYDSFDTVRLPKIDYEITKIERDLKNDIPLFVDSNRIILDWHEVVERFGFLNNLFYLRACFKAEGVESQVWGIGENFDPQQDCLAEIFDSRGYYSTPRVARRIDSSIPLDQQINQFKGYNDCISIHLGFKNWAYLGDRNSDKYLFRMYEWIKSLPSVDVPKTKDLPDNSSEGRELIYFLEESTNGAISYLGQSQFLVSFEASTVAAAATGRRGSPFIDAIITAAEGPVTSHLGGIAANTSAKIADGIDYMRKWERNTFSNKRDQIRKDGEDCASDPNIITEVECRRCVDEKGNLNAELDSLLDDVNWEITIDIIGSGVIGCGMGIAIGSFLGGIGATIGCAITAIAALLEGGGKATTDWERYREEVKNITDEAYHPCSEMPMSIDWDSL